MYTKNCLICGTEFKSRTEGYCSMGCEIEWRDQNYRKKKGASETLIGREKGMQQTQSTEKIEKSTKPKEIEPLNTGITIAPTPQDSNKLQKQTENLENSMELSEGLKKDILESMSTLDGLSKNLLGSLKSMTSSETGNLKYVGPDKMKDLNETSKQLISCIRAKIELGRLGKEFMEMEKRK